MLKTMMENKNKYHDLRPGSQRKDRYISKTFTWAFHHSNEYDEASD